MKRRVHKRDSALSDLAESGAYTGRDSLDAELRFYEAAEAAFDQLAEMPTLGHVFQTERGMLSGLRVCVFRDTRSIWCSTELPRTSSKSFVSCMALAISTHFSAMNRLVDPAARITT